MKAGTAGQPMPVWTRQSESAGDRTVSSAAAAPDPATGAGSRFGGLIGDLAGALLVLWLIPVAIVVVGAPVALLTRAIVELVQRW